MGGLKMVLEEEGQCHYPKSLGKPWILVVNNSNHQNPGMMGWVAHLKGAFDSHTLQVNNLHSEARVISIHCTNNITLSLLTSNKSNTS
jgi:hypothetical protein